MEFSTIKMASSEQNHWVSCLKNITFTPAATPQQKNISENNFL